MGELDGTELTKKAEAAFRRVVAKVWLRARQTGTPVIVWEEGRVRAIFPGGDLPGQAAGDGEARVTPETTADGGP